MSVTEVVTAVVAGGVGEFAREKIKDKIGEAIPGPRDQWELFLDAFPHQWQTLLSDIHKLANSSGMMTLRTTQTLQAYPYEYTIQTMNRPHISIFCLTSYQVRLFVAGVGIFIATLNAGWNAVDIPDQSTISLPMGTSGSQVVMIQASDNSLGVAI